VRPNSFRVIARAIPCSLASIIHPLLILLQPSGPPSEPMDELGSTSLAHTRVGIQLSIHVVAPHLLASAVGVWWWLKEVRAMSMPPGTPGWGSLVSPWFVGEVRVDRHPWRGGQGSDNGTLPPQRKGESRAKSQEFRTLRLRHQCRGAAAVSVSRAPHRFGFLRAVPCGSHRGRVFSLDKGGALL